MCSSFCLETGLELGLTKNIVDVCCVLATCILTLTFAHRVIGIGIGTLAGMFGTGRVIAVFNRLFGAYLIPLGKEPISWYQDKRPWPFILVFVNLWKGIGYNCIIYLSTIIGFDRGLYEAAAIDGATKWQQITKITLPLLRPTIIMLTLMAVGRIFYSDFGLFYQVPQNSGALLSVTNTIDTYVYRGLLELGDITMSAAAGVYQSLVGFVLVLAANLAVKKIDPDSALF